jgi:hypothetical protein
VSLTLTPIGPLAIYLNYIGGPERDHQDSDFRNLVDLGVVAHIGSRLTLMVNADYGNDMNAIAPAMADPGIPMPAAPDPAAAGVAASNAQWAGVAVYVRVQATKRFAAIARGEIFWDIDGFRTGVKQRIMELTLTPELKITDALVLRGEFRIDQSDQGIFFKSDGTSTRKYQPTLALNALYAF